MQQDQKTDIELLESWCHRLEDTNNYLIDSVHNLEMRRDLLSKRCTSLSRRLDRHVKVTTIAITTLSVCLLAITGLYFYRDRQAATAPAVQTQSH